ncbi:MAG TPA: hypothetical protein VFA83_19450 [Acidimicrobiales bacterium]|nr:hypothetical protein [Acidimicrobiales bacterium]
MTTAVVVTNLILGLVYTSYGIMTIFDLKRGWKELGFSHFGMAWIAMAFTCGPHHLEHAFHLASVSRGGVFRVVSTIGIVCHPLSAASPTRFLLDFGKGSGPGSGGPLDLAVVLVGFPAGVIWFLLRVEALRGGRGDRFVSGTPKWVAALPVLSAIYLVVVSVIAVSILVGSGAVFGPRYTPNVLLLLVYCLIGYYLLRTQLANREPLGGWSVSGLALTIVFPTCGVMHAVFVVYAASGRYDVGALGRVIDWLAVPAAIYFVWVVRSLYLGTVDDWNQATTGATTDVTAAPALA